MGLCMYTHSPDRDIHMQVLACTAQDNLSKLNSLNCAFLRWRSQITQISLNLSRFCFFSAVLLGTDWVYSQKKTLACGHGMMGGVWNQSYIIMTNVGTERAKCVRDYRKVLWWVLFWGEMLYFATIGKKYSSTQSMNMNWCNGLTFHCLILITVTLFLSNSFFT